jgi:signal transduction histidine kinase
MPHLPMPHLKDPWFDECGRQPLELMMDTGRQPPAEEDPMPAVTSTLSRSPRHLPVAGRTGRPGCHGGSAAEGRHARAHVLAERARIAREIHDILAYTLGSLFVQLDAAEALLCEGGDADLGSHLVGEARRLAAEGLEETRRAIAALRADPVPLPEALADLTKGNGRISQTVSGSPRKLRPGAGLALYRTAQEALANACKHAPGAPVAMTLSFEDQTVSIRVTNSVQGSANGHPFLLAATGGGYGLYGLKERAELLGGTLRAGPSEGDWVVELRVPA